MYWMNSTACSPKIITPDLYNHHRHRFAPTTQCGKTAEERFYMLARGWLAYPVTSIHSHLPPKSGCRNHIPRLANNLYNRSSAVDSLIHNQPPGRQANLGLQLYNRPSAVASPIGRHPQKRPPPSATIPKNRPSSSDCANGAMQKNAEERLYMSSQQNYPVTPIFYLLHERRSPRLRRRRTGVLYVRRDTRQSPA